MISAVFAQPAAAVPVLKPIGIDSFVRAPEDSSLDPGSLANSIVKWAADVRAAGGIPYPQYHPLLPANVYGGFVPISIDEPNVEINAAGTLKMSLFDFVTQLNAIHAIGRNALVLFAGRPMIYQRGQVEIAPYLQALSPNDFVGWDDYTVQLGDDPNASFALIVQEYDYVKSTGCKARLVGVPDPTDQQLGKGRPLTGPELDRLLTLHESRGAVMFVYFVDVIGPAGGWLRFGFDQISAENRAVISLHSKSHDAPSLNGKTIAIDGISYKLMPLT